jgi:hypothetical protein
MEKKIFDVIFIVISAAILIGLSKFDLVEKHMGFSLLPILIAQQLGQYSERKFK